MSQCSNLPSVREIVEKYELAPKKVLGQNFLFDLNITDKIVKVSGDVKNSCVIEIGAGPGALTRSILKAEPKEFYAIEKDSRCIKALEELKSYYPNLNVIEADAIKFAEEELLGGQKAKIIANLPYNIGTVLLFKWLDKLDSIESVTIMLQKEVVDRIVAEPCSKDYGRVAIMTQSACLVQRHFDVPPQAFFPAPKVTSSVVSIIPSNKNKEVDREILGNICKAAFGQRRKMFKLSLKSYIKNSEEVLELAGIDPKIRPEDVSVEDFCKLAKVVKNNYE